ncbi:MAG TPA: glycoside hydrolase family 10 [Planctomycetes bacterium]|nr:glycoside hydrolase family 10 [Planctomycetota bacterium]
MRNYFHSSTFRTPTCPKSVTLTMFALAFILMILAPIQPCCAQDENASQILDEASANTEKYRKSDAIVTFTTEAAKPIRDAEVTIEQTSHDFLFGNIIFPVVGVLGKFEDIQVFRPQLFKRRFADVFNMAIFPFYWSSYEPIPGREDWDKIVPIVDWCKINGITPKGHPLAWVESGGTPRWLYDLPTELTEDLLKARITRIVKGFAGKIDIWDVVNEPAHTVTWSSVMKDPYGTRYTAVPIKDIADWVEKCYRWAHQANPAAELIINDYEQIVTHFIPDTRVRFYNLVAELKKRGTPLHGIGLQAHAEAVWYSPHEFWETLNYYAKLELPIHITEFIPQSSGKEIKGGWKQGKWTKEAQAEFAEQTYRLSFGHPWVASINWWGLSDRYIWMERPGGGLIDENYRPKPAYTTVRNLIKKEWMTKTTRQTAEDGSVDFRGFYGDYNITLKPKEGAVQTFNIHLKKGEANKWQFQILRN